MPEYNGYDILPIESSSGQQFYEVNADSHYLVVVFDRGFGELLRRIPICFSFHGAHDYLGPRQLDGSLPNASKSGNKITD